MSEEPRAEKVSPVFSHRIFRASRVAPLGSSTAFTLIELLVVIAIIAILAIVVILVLAPAQLIMQARDSNRLQDLATVSSAINLLRTDQPSISLGTVSTTYLSLPDPTATSSVGDQCQGLGLPTSSVPYGCSASSTYRKSDGTGWIPLTFSSLSYGSPLGSLPSDPVNQSSSGLFYTYQTNGTQYEVTSLIESSKYKFQFSSNPMIPNYPEVIAHGTNLNLSALWNPSGLVGYWPMDEGAGTLAQDISGGGATLTVAPSSSLVTWQSGKIGGGLKYDPTAPVSCTNGQFGVYASPIPATIQNLPSGSFAISFWEFYVSGINVLLHLTGSYSGGGFNGLMIQGTTVHFNNNSLTDTSFSYTGAVVNNWHQLTYVFDASAGKHFAYIDGIMTGSGNLSGTYGSFSDINMGIYSPVCVDSARGVSFDDLRIYNRALSAAEAQSLYNATK